MSKADAIDTLRAYEEAEAARRQPVPQPCHQCGHSYAGCACPICKEERPAYTALKAISASTNEGRTS